MSIIQPPVQIQSQRIIKPNFDVFYPMAVHMSNIQIQQKINTAIWNLVNYLISIQGYYDNPATQIMGWYEIKTNERGILSLSIGTYGYPPKAAHGMTYIKSLTFDVGTGKLYQLGDLFKQDSDYVKILSENIRKQIASRQLPLLGEFKGIKPDQDYYIADKALVVYFQLYEITPYYVGLPMFSISVFDLQDIIPEDGLLSRVADNN